ncbi:MAG: WG repeat-containing protein [Crocinitomicaceae bacterium]|nr:MAG: WG repeat-containing protein [Crocinitomicaceae bacterium]
MKKLIFILLFIITDVARANSVYDTIYHPFYLGRQVIELRIHSTSSVEKGFVQIDQSVASKSNLPKYLIRDSTGKIIAKYNDLDNSLTSKQLISCEASKLIVKAHRLTTKNTASYIGMDDSGFNIVYPVFTCLPNDNGQCLSMKFGLLDSLGSLVIPIEYDQISWTDSVFITKKNDAFFLISDQFKVLLSDYQLIEYINQQKDHLLLKKNNVYGLIHRSGKYLLPMEFETIRNSKFMYGKYEFLKDGLWGFVDYSFSQFLNPFSPSPNLLQRDRYFEYRDDKEIWTVLDSTGHILLRSSMEMYQVITKNRFLVFKYTRENGYERHLVDAFGKPVIDQSYYDIWRVNNTTLIAGYDAKIHDASNLRKSYKWILLDQNGQPKTTEIYKSIQPIDEHFLSIWTFKNKQQVIDDLGNDVLGYSVDGIYKYSEHVYKIQLDGKHQFLDLHEPNYVSKKYDQIQCISENRFGVQKDGLYGFINGTTFEEITPINADQITCFKDGIASMKMNNEWILIDTLGLVYTKDRYKNTKLLENGFAQVEKEGKYGIIDENGRSVVPIIYEEMKFIVNHENSYFIGVKKNGKYGIINIKNEVIYPFIFETCAELSVHVNIPFNRQNGFYAFLSITNRRTIEYYYLNFDPKKNELKIHENPTKGFKTISASCSSNPYGKCVGIVNWDGNTIIPMNFVNIKELKYNTFVVYSSKGAGLMDTLGRTLIPPIYAYMYELGRDSTLLQVGRHSGTWGLYTRSGKMIADTIYGGFEEPIKGLIPFYANMHFRIENNRWVHDEKKIGFMDQNGRIVIEPYYDQIYKDSPKKGFIQLKYGTNYCTIDDAGNLIEGKFATETSNEFNFNDVHDSAEQYALPTNDTKKKYKRKKRKKVRWL